MEENKNEEVKEENNVQTVDNNNNCKCGDNCKCKKKGVPLVVAILVCILAGALGAFLGDKVFNMTEKKTERKTEEKTEEKSNSNETSNSNEQKKEENTNELTEEVKDEMYKKVSILLGKADSKKGALISIEELKDDLAMNLMKNKFTEEDKTILILKTSNGEDFTKNYKFVYGTEPKYVSTVCPAMKYDTTKKEYVSADGGCGGTSFPTVWFYIDDVVKASDTIISVQAYVGAKYVNYEAGETTYFSDYYDYDYFDDNGIAKNAPITKETKITEQNKTQFTKYNFNFEKSTDGNYYYKNVEKAK